MSGARVTKKPTKRVPPEHDARVEIGAGYSGPGYYFAECRCGWAGPPTTLKELAELDASRHMEESK